MADGPCDDIFKLKRVGLRLAVTGRCGRQLFLYVAVLLGAVFVRCAVIC